MNVMEPKDGVTHHITCQNTTSSKPRGGAPKANKNAETHGHYRRKTKLEPVSFDDLNFSSSNGEQLTLRRDELIRHCGGSVNVVKRRIIERICFLLVSNRSCGPVSSRPWSTNC